MALVDNLVLQVYPVAGETAVKNIVDDSTFSGTGTPAIVDVAGEDAWQVTSGTLLDCVIPSKTVDGSVDGNGVTIAMRLQLTANGTDDFLNLLGIHNSASAISTGARFLRAGSGTYRGRLNNDLAATLGGLTTTNVLTLVYRARTGSGSAQDFGDLWVQTIGRVGTDPDTTSSAANIFSSTFNRFFINCQSNAQYNLLDIAYWDRELTDAEAASVADTYRAVMPSPSAGGVDVTGSSSRSASVSLPAGVVIPEPIIVSGAASNSTSQSLSAVVDIAEGIVFSGDSLLKSVSGGVAAPITGTVVVDVYDLSTGALVERFSGVQIVNGSGSVDSANITPSTVYRVVVSYSGSDGVKRIESV